MLDDILGSTLIVQLSMLLLENNLICLCRKLEYERNNFSLLVEI